MAGYTKRAVFLATLLCGAVFAAPEASAAETTPYATTEAETAVVRVTIQQADGTKLRSTKVVQWGAVAQFDLGGHDLDLEVTNKQHMTVSYTRDGAKVIVKVIPTKVRIETTQL